MKRITAIEHIEDLAGYLFVEAVCPKCRRILISLAQDAGKIVTFGCAFCGDIDNSTLLSLDDLSTSTSTNGEEQQVEQY